MTDRTVDTPPDAPPAAAKIWPRAAFMVAFAVMVAIAQNLLLLIAVLQALWLGFSGAPNARIARFGDQLGAWLADVARFQAAVSEHKPFPWADWPAGRG